MFDGEPSQEIGEVRPYFQPVVSLQTRRIVGYESLGRAITGDSVTSLGAFFHDPTVPPETHRRVDRDLRAKAMAQLAAHHGDELLFLNVRPSWMYRYWKRYNSLRTIEMLEDLRIDPARIVVEVTEDSFPGNLVELSSIVEQYRRSGCKVALDDVGSGFGYLDRVALLRPDLVKVDLRTFAEELNRRASETMIRGYALFAEQAGASLIVEGAETEDDLRFCLTVGARYVQGLVFSPAGPNFLPEDTFAPYLDKVIAAHRREITSSYQTLLSEIEQMRTRIQSTPIAGLPDGADLLIGSIIKEAAPQCIRIYVCDRHGTQLSSNWTRGADGVWTTDPAYRGSNWSWRPFSIPSTVMMMLDKRGTLSASYKDLETDYKVRTYSCPVGEDNFIFLDFIDMSA